MLFALYLAGQPPGYGAAISVEVARHGDRFDVSASAAIECDQTHAWKVLTDYERLVQFIPGMSSSRVVSRSGNSLVIDQNGEASLLFFRIPLRISAIWVLGGWFLLQIYSVLTAEKTAEIEVAWWAHIGGFAAGLAITFLLRSRLLIRTSR